MTPSALRDRDEPLHALEHVVVEPAAHHAAHPLARRHAILRAPARRACTCRSARPGRAATRRSARCRSSSQSGITSRSGSRQSSEYCGCDGDELLAARPGEVERGLDLRGRPLAEAEVARLARAHDLGQRLHRLLERCSRVVAVALVEVDVFGAQAPQRLVDLLVHLRRARGPRSRPCRPSGSRASSRARTSRAAGSAARRRGTPRRRRARRRSPCR